MGSLFSKQRVLLDAGAAGIHHFFLATFKCLKVKLLGAFRRVEVILFVLSPTGYLYCSGASEASEAALLKIYLIQLIRDHPRSQEKGTQVCLEINLAP